MIGSGLLKPKRLRFELAAHIDSNAASGCRPRADATELAHAILDLVEGRDEQQTHELLDSVRLLTRLHSAPACRRCVECDGQEHHFSDSGLVCPEDGSTPHYACKHCEAKAHVCDECDGPIYPITGAAVCAECTAKRGDFEP